MITDKHIQRLNDQKPAGGSYVLYWMQQSQRAVDNPALAYAIHQANDSGQCVVVGFGLTDAYPEVNLRHFAFMLEGLQETLATLAQQGIKMVIRLGDPAEVALALGRKASMIICDRGYLSHQSAWRTQVARSAVCPVIQVEGDVVVPLAVVSQKAEYAARTIRPKIHKHLNDYLTPFETPSVNKTSLGMKLDGIDLKRIEPVLEKLSIDRSVPPVTRFFEGGTSKGKAELNHFIQQRLQDYAKNSNQPQTDDISHMSPYLHFGQLSAQYIAMQIRSAGGRLKDAKAAYLEELIVRRELAMNFVHYSPNYASFACLPQWAQKTLKEHLKDKREYSYTRSQLENAATHDEYWNAAMREMKTTGFMHNYMRMYWGKKILEWSKTPQHAFRTTLALNNKYFLDGRDPNSYAGVAWIFGLHDRAWAERPIFGKIRYMAASGLERKCDIQAYVEKVDDLAAKK